MKRPIESDYTSHVAYTRALEEYCDQQKYQLFGYVDMASYALLNSVRTIEQVSAVQVFIHTQPFMPEKDNPLSECVAIYTTGGT